MFSYESTLLSLHTFIHKLAVTTDTNYTSHKQFFFRISVFFNCATVIGRLKKMNFK